MQWNGKPQCDCNKEDVRQGILLKALYCSLYKLMCSRLLGFLGLDLAGVKLKFLAFKDVPITASTLSRARRNTS